MKDTWRIRIVSAEIPPRDVLESAQVIAGGRRQLEMLSDKLTAEKIPLGANALEQARMLIQRAEQEKVVILASGDPLYCGIGGTISKLVDAEHLDIDPGITAFQRLFARLGRPWENAALFSVGSDGTDGPTDAAGGYVDGGTLAALTAHGLDVAAVLAQNDAYHALAAVDGLLITGPTGTNVNDVAVLLLE